MKTQNGIGKCLARSAAACFAISMVTFELHAAPGDVDLSFEPGSGVDGSVYATAVQPDGKVLVGGSFTAVKGLVRTRIARLNADGSGDSSFDSGAGANNDVKAVALLPDGKVLIVGSFTTINNINRNRIARLNADGSLDGGFDPGSGANLVANSVAVQADGKVLVAGAFSSMNGISRKFIARLEANGSLDNSFNSGIAGNANSQIYAVALQSDGKVLIAGSFSSVNAVSRTDLARLNSDGSLDATFSPGKGANGSVFSVALQPDGKVLIGGGFTTVNSTNRNRIARLNMDGSLDTSFSPGVGPNSSVTAVASQPDGKVLIGGAFTFVSNKVRNHVARLNGDGTLDTNYNAGADDQLWSIAVQGDGNVLISGFMTAVNGTNRFHIARLTSNGSLDTSFDPDAGVNSTVFSTAVQPDGKVLIGGQFSAVGGVNRNAIARLNADGAIDTGFNSVAVSDNSRLLNYISSIALSPNGQPIIAGKFSTIYYGLARLQSDGSLDTSFNPPSTGSDEGRFGAIAAQLDGKVLITGLFLIGDPYQAVNLARLNADGSLDPSFSLGIDGTSVGAGDGNVRSIAVGSDGSVVIGGDFEVVNGTNHRFIARLNADGSLDTNFSNGIGGDSTSYISSLAVQLDGKVLIGGIFSSVDGKSRTNIARLNRDGSLDEGFNPGTGANAAVSCVVVQPDGKVLVGGGFTSINGTICNGIARLNANGSLDTGFDPGKGANFAVNSIALQPDGGVLVGGGFTTFGDSARWRVARLIGGDIPVITLQPQNQFVNAGDLVAITVAATGNPLPNYQWLMNGTNIVGATNSSLTLTNVQKTDEGLYSVIVSNRVGWVSSSNATLRVNLPPVADAGATKLLLVSANGTNATVILDGSRSSDPDSDSMHYTWFEVGQANPLAIGVVAVVVLPAGQHPVELVVSDGMAARTNVIHIDVLTTAQAVARLEALVNSGVTRSQPLEVTLAAALASIERSNAIPAVNQLLAFQNKVRAQIAPVDPGLAETFIQAAQDVIDVLSGGHLNPGGHPQGRITSLARLANGHVQLHFSAGPGRPCIVETSTNLVDWEMIGVATRKADGNYEFEDAPAAGFPNRFYRILSPYTQ